MAKQSDAVTLWLYLARRDKKGVKILAILSGRRHPASRIPDLSVLQLPEAWFVEINQTIQDNRMLWESWIEAAETYDELRLNLKKRGYTNLPLNGQPQYSRADLLAPPKVNVAILPKNKTMTRRAES